MSNDINVTVHEIAVDGLPDMDKLTGRVAFIFDGCIVSGWPLPHGLWEANSDVGRVGIEGFGSVTHWVEFPEPLWDIERRKERRDPPRDRKPFRLPTLSWGSKP